MDELLPAVLSGGHDEAVKVGDRSLGYGELGEAASAAAARLAAGERVALWAEPALETCVGVVAALLAGAVGAPVNPRIGTLELAHVLRDAAPRNVLAGPGTHLPNALAALTRIDVDPEAPGRPVPSPVPRPRPWCSSHPAPPDRPRAP
jgi:malonyl-CoA/methylmalonyl-CoA synthetase